MTSWMATDNPVDMPRTVMAGQRCPGG
jgi:hypothetical protein